MTITAKDRFVLAGVVYGLESVLKHAKSGPEVSIKREDINDETVPEHVSSFRTEVPFIDNGSIVFYKQRGKYTILLGKLTAQDMIDDKKFNGILTGRLISSVTLKKAKIE
ncbi:MAG: hypothetical protein ACD_84C00001G0006 [uncultured bacterium]|nr:MAG: hypothetical protein ACD_84C00001G0006 [uncultured bacterium]